MGGTCTALWRDEKCVQNFVRKHLNYSGDLGAKGRITLIWTREKC